MNVDTRYVRRSEGFRGSARALGDAKSMVELSLRRVEWACTRMRIELAFDESAELDEDRIGTLRYYQHLAYTEARKAAAMLSAPPPRCVRQVAPICRCRTRSRRTRVVRAVASKCTSTGDPDPEPSRPRAPRSSAGGAA